MTLVIDASVAFKWFVEESGSDAAQRVLERERARIAPDWVLVEIANTARKKEQREEISPDHATAIVESAPRFFTRLVPAATLLERALAVARVLGHPVYDCLYLALADEEQARLVTADRRLVQRVAGSRWARRVRPLVG